MAPINRDKVAVANHKADYKDKLENNYIKKGGKGSDAREKR